MSTISFFALGTPVAQPRPRAGRPVMIKDRFGNPVRDKYGKPIMRGSIFNPSDADQWKRDIAFAAKPHIPKEPLVGPVELDLTFYLPRPQGHYGTGKNAGKLKGSAPMFCKTKPDADNAIKACMDTLTQGRFWLDDCQVVKLRAVKLYENPPALKPGCQITIVPLENKAATSAARFVLGDAPAASGAEQPLLIQT
jgi:Holliday junction resolvase RusA-like endonuclease